MVLCVSKKYLVYYIDLRGRICSCPTSSQTSAGSIVNPPASLVSQWCNRIYLHGWRALGYSFWIIFYKHEVSVKGWMKDLQGPEWCKNVKWVSMPFTCNMRTKHTSFHIHKFQILHSLHLKIFILHVYCTHVEYFFFLETVFIWTWFLEV